MYNFVYNQFFLQQGLFKLTTKRTQATSYSLHVLFFNNGTEFDSILFVMPTELRRNHRRQYYTKYFDFPSTLSIKPATTTYMC